MLVIIDYGLGNLRSIQKAFERLKVEVVISSDERTIEKAHKLVLPGVGYFAAGMDNLRKTGLLEVITEKVLKGKIPILGICLGMQLMTNYSEEGDCAGLGWIDSATKRFDFRIEGTRLRIPHMGWNTITPVKEDSLLKDIEQSEVYYFVHSYRVKCDNDSHVLARTSYGVEFDSAFHKDNIWGVQFHPEKSHKAGLKLLQNFVSL